MVYLLVILLFSILGLQALFHPGLFTAHDIWHQVVRFYYFSQAVSDGQFPPYWIGQLANGFGYPLFFFSYHLPWLIGVALLKLGFNISGAIKVLFFLSYFSSGITMYLLVNNLLKSRLSALLSSMLYLWLPYHFLIIFVGGSLGIAFVFIFLPLIFLGINLIKENSKLGIPMLALGLSGVVLSHLMHLVFLFPAILIFCLFEFISSKTRINFLKNICLGLLLGILISSFYLIPAAYYHRFTKASQETGFSEIYKRNFVNFSQLIYSKWGFGPIVNNAKDGENSFQLGFAQWISIVALLLMFVFKKLSKRYYSLSIYLLLSFAVSIFLMLDFSKPIWALLVKFATVDFPFRLLLPVTFIASICAGVVLKSFNKKLLISSFIFLVAVAIYTNRNHIRVNQYTNFTISTYLGLETEITTNTFNEYLPVQANNKLLHQPWNELSGGNFFSNTKHKTNLLSFDLNVKKAEEVSIGQFYFPGQTLYLDNKIQKFNIDKDGRIKFSVPLGTHQVTVNYKEPPLIKTAKLATIFGILILVYLIAFRLYW